MNKIISLFLFCTMILLNSCSPKKEIEKVNYLGKTKAEIIREKGNPMEDDKDGLTVYDEAIVYGTDLLNYEVFFFKKDICFQHNETYPVERFDEKYKELKKQFGEPVK